MGIDELVSDWEIDEIRIELESGDAPDVVAFRHGIPQEQVRSMARSVGRVGVELRRWSDAESAFLADNYPSHGKPWDGWAMLGRTWDAVRKKASRLGVRHDGK